MKVKVIKEFVDKYEKVLHEVGSTFECNADRLKEIQKAGSYVEVVKEPAKKAIEK